MLYYKQGMNKNHRIKSQIWIVVPAYNEQGTVRTVIKNILKIVPTILVVDDASTDKTSQYLEDLPITTIYNKINLGYTKSIEKGLRHAFEHGADYAITFDADGQHLAKDLNIFIKIIESQRPALIVGNRSFKNRFVEIIFGLYTKRQFGISDPFCGFKAYSKDFFKQLGDKLEYKYSIGTERIFVELRSSQNQVVEIDLTTAKRKDRSRFAGALRGNLLELKAALNILRSVYF